MTAQHWSQPWCFLPDTKSSDALKTGFERCTMQISNAINDAISSVRVGLKEWNKENVKLHL
ncbi:hypothetical protein T06_8392 [Trichinella sp. T6]|nr:hypothetical protein T06_8392 [Trichinella sp. T6]